MTEQFKKFLKKEKWPINFSQIKFKTTFKNCVHESLKARGWKETEADDWDLLWVERELAHEIFDGSHLMQNQKINHYRNNYELTRKDNLIKNLKRHKKNLEKAGQFEGARLMDFWPVTYNLPSDYILFVEEFKKQQERSPIYIMKPINRSQGKGIFLFNKLNQITTWKNDTRYKPENNNAEPYIVQRYVSNPLLIGGKKFDLRIYALVTSYIPLTIYIYRSGFCRFTSTRYNENMNDLSNLYMHLTNVAVQKTCDSYDEKSGGKMSLQKLRNLLGSFYGEEKTLECFNSIQNIIIYSLQSVQKAIIADKHCFELYGYDILIDSDLKPWLLEINASPSMTANSKEDSELKCKLLDDVMTVLDFEKVMRGDETQVGGFDLVYKGNLLITQPYSIYTNYLGCFNNRENNLEIIGRDIAQRLNSLKTEVEDDKKKVKKRIKVLKTVNDPEEE